MTYVLATAGLWHKIAQHLARSGRLAVVTIVATHGSTPREVGASMIVLEQGGFSGTIGGGTLEWQALGAAQAALAGRRQRVTFRHFALGPELGQCCGGRLELAIELWDESDRDLAERLAAAEAAGPGATCLRRDGDGTWRRAIADADAAALLGAARLRRLADGAVLQRFGDERTPLHLFGAGHVGRAVVLALAPLPFRITWVDPRPDAFPGHVPGNVELQQPEDPAAALDRATAGSFVLVMSHSHALDLDIVALALLLERFPYLGLIGSATKRARFMRRLGEMGLAAAAERDLVCPIGLASIRSKHPAAIAAGVAADLLSRRERLAAAAAPQAQDRAHG